MQGMYFTTYKGKYFTGMDAKEQGCYYRITGRVDDVINVSGHKLEQQKWKMELTNILW